MECDPQRDEWRLDVRDKQADAKFYSLIIADTISYMHRRNILFRDLKPENVMIDNEGKFLFVY